MQRYGSSRVVDNIDLSEADEWFQDSDKSPDSNLEDEFATRQFLLDAIAQLSEKQKFVIWQLYFEGWSMPQIANHLQVKTNAIYKRHFDALKALRKILEEN
jgi:RNA polymerase sigma factor (sigma-70 family)